MRTMVTMALVAMMSVVLVWSQGGSATQTIDCNYLLDSAELQPGTAAVLITANELVIDVAGANPETLYTVWVDFKSRATDTLASDYPLAAGAQSRGVAPAFPTTAGVTSGMGVDPNGIVTDDRGRGQLAITLDYNLLDAGASPVVSDELLLQGHNRIGGGWLRVFPLDPAAGPTFQSVDPDSGLPLLHRATAQGFTIVRHPDHISHGHTPGVGGVDHFPAFSGDFHPTCRGVAS